MTGRRRVFWNAPIGLPSVQLVPQHVLNFFFVLSGLIAVLKLAHISLNRWCAVWRSRFCEGEVEILYALDVKR